MLILPLMEQVESNNPTNSNPQKFMADIDAYPKHEVWGNQICSVHFICLRLVNSQKFYPKYFTENKYCMR